MSYQFRLIDENKPRQEHPNYLARSSLATDERWNSKYVPTWCRWHLVQGCARLPGGSELARRDSRDSAARILVRVEGLARLACSHRKNYILLHLPHQHKYNNNKKRQFLRTKFVEQATKYPPGIWVNRLDFAKHRLTVKHDDRNVVDSGILDMRRLHRWTSVEHARWWHFECNNFLNIKLKRCVDA